MALTVRGTEEFIQSFKDLTGEKTATGALVSAARIGVSATAELKAAKRRIVELEQANATYRQAIANLQTSCVQVAELAAQQDLFNN